MAHCPVIVVGGASSGVGKTSISLGLTHAFSKRGIKTRAFKVGPDFLDPTYLKISSGHTCYNLDTWMMGEDYVVESFKKHTKGFDLAIIEGVMGLFDGPNPDNSKGSTAEVARLLNAPTILAVNAKGVGRTIAATVKGFCDLEKEISIAGVVANQAGSEKHAQILDQALTSCSLPPLVGSIPKESLPTLPSRHLGLVSADKNLLNDDMLNQLSESMEKYLNLDRLLELARSAIAPSSGHGKYFGDAPDNPKVRLGLAWDDAFHFIYNDNLSALQDAGVELARFSPINDRTLPDDIDGLYICGGYPEVYAGELAENRAMRGQIANFVQSGAPVYAECGGLIYLSKGVETLDNRRHDFVGLLPTWTRMTERFRALGYYEATTTDETIFGDPGTKFRGHKFHYSTMLDSPSGKSGWRSIYSLHRARTGEMEDEGYCYKNTVASYVHAHLASKPDVIKNFTNNLCRRN